MTLIGAAKLPLSVHPHMLFQSLFSWMTLIGRFFRPEGVRGQSRFQSLFSWMTLIGAEVDLVGNTEGRVSILVFLDDAHRQIGSDAINAVNHHVSILVFLDDAHRHRLQ